MGIGTIMRSKKILLIAYGKSKAEAIRNMVKGDINPMVPSSILNLHKDVTILIDKEAASLL
jgi:glucosamine-6-phosphate deaminase